MRHSLPIAVGAAFSPVSEHNRTGRAIRYGIESSDDFEE
jgi:hypothetical protein